MSSNPFPRRIAVLGSTGSIGRKALAIADRYPDRFTVTALAAHSSVEDLAAQARHHRVMRVAIGDANRVEELRGLLPRGSVVEGGAQAVAALAERDDVDLVVNGVVGRAGLEASLLAARNAKMLALANKESLVLAGELLMATAKEHGATLLPVDSEHSGLFQCLEGKDPGEVRRLIITASGGPFRGRKRAALESVTPEAALRHPVWPMGPRITVDSATLFNKGLEVIETYRLFDIALDAIDVWVHPQSVVHALVETVDGGLLAQMSTPDMMLPVQYAMTWPQRWDCEIPTTHLPDWGSLTFEAPDHETFPAIELARRAVRRGGTAATVLNAADEIAVQAFLEERIRFPEIIELVEAVLEEVPVQPADSLDAVSAADAEARAAATRRLEVRSA